MEFDKETPETVQAQFGVLRKGIISKENYTNYYKSIVDKRPEDSDTNIGMKRIYQDLLLEEKQHVERFSELILKWENRLKQF